MSGHTDREFDDAGRALLLMRSRGRAFAVFADESDGVAEGLRPTPLPNAPRAVLGLVCMRGRMRTVLDPSAVLDDGEEVQAPPGEVAQVSPRLKFVALRGDEQLALAVESAVEIPPREISSPADAPASPATIEHEGARVPLLDASRLFDAAMRGTERRRKRTGDK